MAVGLFVVGKILMALTFKAMLIFLVWLCCEGWKEATGRGVAAKHRKHMEEVEKEFLEGLPTEWHRERYREIINQFNTSRGRL